MIFIFIFAVFVATTYADEFPTETFDFIVVGGGTAGCAVASRLSENGRHSVLLLEAGDFPHPDLEIPALGSRLIGQPSTSRLYPVVPQRNAGLKNNGTLNYIVGWTLGGTSSINGMYFNRGSPYDFNHWADVTGDPSWNYANMLKYFQKSESYAGGFPSNQHGYSGPISVSRARNFVPQLEEWLGAGQELGYPIADQNGPQRVSFTPVEYAQRLGRRVSSFFGYIRPHLESRRNLKVMTNAEVMKILFEKTKAVGVLFRQNATSPPRFVRCTKEVIVSAGVVGSPALLLRSGVGPGDVLWTGNIPVVKYLAGVGMNFQDHTASFLDFIINNRSAIFDPQRDLTPENRRIYDEFGDGPFTYSLAGPGQAFIASPVQVREGNPQWADMQLTNVILSSGVPGLSSLQIPLELRDSEASTSCGIVIRGRSRGRVILNTTDVSLPPIIDSQYLSHPDDFEIFLHGIKTTLKIYEETDHFRRLGTRYPTIPHPGCEHLRFRSDDYWRCYLTQTSISGVHAGGTCRMGSGRDPQDVVDTSLKVFGVEGLRVVDASIMPLLTNANPMAAIYGIAEKASDMILSQWEHVHRGGGGRGGDVSGGWGWGPGQIH